MIQYGVHFDPPEGDDSRRKPRVPSTGRGFESISLQRRVRNEPSQADAGCPTDAGGAVDAMHDSFMPLGGMVLILNMVLGENHLGRRRLRALRLLGVYPFVRSMLRRKRKKPLAGGQELSGGAPRADES